MRAFDLFKPAPSIGTRLTWPMPSTLLSHTSPVTWEHIGFSGDFLWDRAAATGGRRRALNLGRDEMAA